MERDRNTDNHPNLVKMVGEGYAKIDVALLCIGLADDHELYWRDKAKEPGRVEMILYDFKEDRICFRYEKNKYKHNEKIWGNENE